MAMDKPRGKDGEDDGLKKRRVTCCACRSTKKHKCYMCFCEKCPSFTKKFPPRYGQKDLFSDSRPSDSSSILCRNEETPVSDKVQMDSTAKQSVKTSDPCTCDEYPPGFSSTLGSSLAVRNGTGDHRDEDRYSKALSPNSRIKSGSSSRPLIVKEQRGDAKVGNQKLVTNEVDGGSSKSHAGSTSVWEVLAANEPKASGNQEGWDKRDDSLSSWGLKPVKEQRGHSAGSDSSWGARKVEKPRGNDEVGNQKLMTNEVDGGSSKSHDGSSSVWDVLAANEPKALGNEEGRGNKAGSVSGWDPWPENVQRGHSSGSDSSRSARRSKEPRALGNEEGRGNKAGSVSGWDPWPENVQRGHSSGSDSSRSARRSKEPRALGNEEGRGNKAGSVSGWDPWPVNVQRGHSSGSDSSRSARRSKEPRALGNEEGRGNKAGSVSGWDPWPVNVQRGHSSGSDSSRSARRSKEPRALGNEEGRGNKAGSVSGWDPWPVNVQRGHSSGSDSSRSARRSKEPRALGNEEGRGNKAGSVSGWDPWPVNVQRGHSSGSDSSRSARRSKEPRALGNEEGRGNKAGSVSGWDPWPVNVQRGHSSGSDSSRSARRSKEPRGSGNQEGWGNKAGSASGWDRGLANERRDNSSRPYSSRSARSDKEPRGNRAGRDTRAGSSPRRSTGNVNAPRRYTAGPISHGGSWRVKEPRENEEVRANRAQDRSSKPVSPTPHDEFGSRWTSCSGKRTTRESEKQNKGSDVGNQKLVTNEVDGGSSKSHAGSTSIWDPLAAKEAKALGNQAGWDNKVGSDSSWGTWPINAPRGNAAKSVSTQDPRRVGEPRVNVGNREVTAKRSQDGSSKRDSCVPHAETGSRWNSYSGKRSRGDEQRMSNGTEDVSFGPVKKPRGNQEIVANTTKDGSSKPELLNTNVDLPRKRPNVESGSNRVPCTVKQSRGNQDIMASIGGDGSCKSVSHHSPSGSSSSDNVKDPKGNQEATANKAKDKTSKQITNPHEPVINPHAQLGSSWSPSESRGNPDAANYRAGDGSSEQVLHSHNADPRSCLNYVTAKEPRGNQEITGYKTENGYPLSVLHDPNYGIVSTPSSLTAKEPTGYSASGMDSVQDDRHHATVVSKNIKGVGGNKKTIDLAVASPRHAKPPPVVISGKSCPSLKDKVNHSHLNILKASSLETFGPVKEIIWKGHFEFLFPGGSRVCASYLAHLAAKVSAKAYRFASQIAGNLQFKIHPSSAFMPKIFTHDIPDARDIALYFYPQRHGRSIKEYAELLKLLEKKDLMLRSVMGPVELLVFTSKVLHEKHQKLEGGHYFLWGVFHQLRRDEVACSSKVVPTPHLGRTEVILNST